VPLLVYGLGLAPREAIGVSLAAVGLAAAFGAAGAIRARLVEYRAAIVFAIAGMLGAPLGVKAAHWLSETTLLTAFATLMLVVATGMWRAATRSPAAASVVRADYVPDVASATGPMCRLESDQQLRLTAQCSTVLALAGVGTGLLAGAFGVGGGFVIVPALTLIARIDIHRAVATSLLIISVVGLAGVSTMLVEGRQLPWLLTNLFIGGALAGMFLGRLLARRTAGPRLQKIFATAIIVVAVFVLASHRY
jgi:uncharacterized protein